MARIQRTILILEDSAEDAATFRRYLERERDVAYICHVANTAADGLAACRSLRPDVILLDYHLPDATGLAFLAALIAEHGPLAFAVVMLTGSGNEAVAVQALKLGAQDYLIKGYDIQQRLLLAVASAINKVDLQRQVKQQRHALEASNRQLQQALEARQASETQLRMALQATKMTTWELDLPTNQVSWGDGLEEMVGMPLGAFVGTLDAFFELVHPDDHTHVRQRLDLALQGGAPYEVEFRMLRPDGSLRWTATRGALMRDPQGVPVRMIGVDMDVSARKQAEAVLRASEQRAQVIWKSASDAIVLSDAEGIVLDANQSYYDLYGYSAEQVIGQSFAIIFPPEQRALAIKQYRELIQQRALLPIYESTIQRANGGTRVIESRANFIDTGDGQIALLSILRDITEREQAARQLRRSEAQFKALVENAPNIIARFDRELRHLYVSPQIERVTGLAQATFIGKTNRELGISDAQCELWEAQSEYVFQTGQPAEYEFTFATPEHLINYQAIIVPELSENGVVETVMSITHDVTAYKQAEERQHFLSDASKALTTSLDYQVTLEQIAHMVIPYLGDACIIDLVDDWQIIDTVVIAHTDPQQEILLREMRRQYAPIWNSAHPVAQVLRTRQPMIVDLIPEAMIDQHTRSPAHRSSFQQLALRSFMMVPLLVREQIIGVISLYAAQVPRRYTAHDLEVLEELVQRSALALDNAQLYQEAQEAIREREAFLSIASHELKNPLTTLLGRSQLLQRRLERKADSPRDLADIGIVINSAQRINQLLSDLLDVSRVTSGQLSVDPVPLDLGSLIRQVVAQAQPSAPNHRISITQPVAMLAVAGDASRLEQVFQNLISNAIKYSPAGGAITIDIAMQDSRARISVQDEGLGIPADTLLHVFKRFYRVSSASTQQIAGSGIGLYVVKEIVARHGGTVDVTSTEAAGSTFTVYLPLAAL